MKRTVLFLGMALVAGSIHAQDILKQHGFNKEPLTLSKGRYKETFINEEVMQVGTVLINTRTDKVVKFLEEDTTASAYRAEATSRFLTMDPLAEKYPWLSPYVYAGNNPIRNIDINGDSITVLNKSDGEHTGLLIQNENSKWQYYSVNGDNVYSSGGHTGGRKFNDVAVGEFDSPQQFMDSQYNSSGDKDDTSINSYGYQEGYVIPTTSEQDQMIAETFTDIAQNEEYKLLGNNCSIVAQRSLEAAGIKTTKTTTTTYRVPANHSLGESSFSVKVSSRPAMPSTSFKNIIMHNPQGLYIRRSR